jgi:uncharacterized caspase-like protein
MVIASQEMTANSMAFTTPAPAAVQPVGGVGSGGADMSNFRVAVVPNVAPIVPKLILNAAQTLPTRAGIINRADLVIMNQQFHDGRTQLFREAIEQLASDPEAADIPGCEQGEADICIVKRERGVNDFVPIVKRKLAVLIGNNNYRSPVPKLQTAINDVNAIGAQLRDQMGYEVTVVQDAGRKEVIGALNALIRTAEPDDSVLIMYAGHGYLTEDTNVGYWIPTDADAVKPDNWVSNKSISLALNNIQSKQVMLVSDSCYSGTLTTEGKQTDTVGVSRDQTLTRRSVLALSSGGEEPVTDEGVDDHSIFAWNLLQSLKTMNTEVSGQKLHTAIKDGVTRDFPQVPQYGAVISAGHTPGGEYLVTPRQGGVRK